MDTLDQILENLWSSDYVQANPNKSYKSQYNSEYVAIGQYMNGGARPDPTNYSKMGKTLVGLEDQINAGQLPDPDPPPDPTPDPDPAPTTVIPVSQTKLDPGEIAAWAAHDSATSLHWGSGGRDKHRIVKWGAFSGDGGRPSLYSGRIMYALMGFRMVQGNPNRMFNWHTQPDDRPDGWYAGGQACNPAQVSPVAIECPDVLQLAMKCQKPGCANPSNRGPAAERWTIAPKSEMDALRGKWSWWWMELKWGNNYQLPAGSVKVWRDEEDTPRLDISPVNTHWLNEHQVTLWEGGYWSEGSPGTTIVETAAVRLGRTPKECYYDVPVVAVREGASNTRGPGGTSTGVTSVPSDAAKIPAPLRW